MDTVLARSKVSALFTSTPKRAARPVPTITAVGVASPSAHGHEMTSTHTACESAAPTSPATTIHTMKSSTASPMTTGTNTPDILSASFSTGAFVEVASSTSAMMCASAVSSPTAVARARTHPPTLVVAPVSASPGPFSTGTLSPVSALSSKAAVPSTTSPSTGTLCPARTTKTSPTFTCAASTSTSRPSTTRTAVSGASETNAETAEVVLDFARASRAFPTVTSVRIMAALSK